MADLISVEQASDLISAGHIMLVAGDTALLSKLPQGRWIGGSTAYFMTEQGGVVNREQVFVTLLKDPVKSANVGVYSRSDLPHLVEDYPQRGCSFIIVPAGSATHLRFDRECATWPGLFNSPLVGWNAGVHLSELQTTTARVFDGTTLQSYDDAAVVLHTTIDPEYVARIEIINAFRQGKGDRITFPQPGFVVTDCFVNGRPRNFAQYIEENSIDVRLPLVADYAGAMINVSFQSIDSAPKRVRLYAPVFDGVEYRLAEPVTDLAGVFGREFDARHVQPAFSCNCILNFLYAQLEGKRTGAARGPITFGEIAYIQLNQTLVYVTFERMQPS